jgi:hypothetical protein
MEDPQMKPWLIVVVVVVVIAVGVGGFFGGKAAGGGTVTPEQAIAALRSGGGGFPGAAGGNGAGGFVTGSIVAQDSGSITVKLADGSTKIVLVPGSATIGVSQPGTASDLAVGKDVTVIGATNSDGTVTATQIQMGTLSGLGGGLPPAGGNGTVPGAGNGAATSTTTGQ